jgi:hypothetical protein
MRFWKNGRFGETAYYLGQFMPLKLLAGWFPEFPAGGKPQP